MLGCSSEEIHPKPYFHGAYIVVMEELNVGLIGISLSSTQVSVAGGRCCLKMVTGKGNKVKKVKG